jgi:hypothetical protein
VRLSGSDAIDGVGTMTGEEAEVSDSFCFLEEGKEVAFLVLCSFMDQDTTGLLA